MRIVVTGAAGNLGSRLCPALTEKGHEVVGVDKNFRRDLPFHLGIANLLDADAMYALLDGADAVVHLGNYSDFMPRNAQVVFNENVAMNQNVFQAAVDRGATKIVFASSIQVIASTPSQHTLDRDWNPAYLPLDDQSAPHVRNPYGLSKHVGEMQLDYLTKQFGITGVAIRFPWMIPSNQVYKERGTLSGDALVYTRQMAFAYLLFSDAVTLIESFLDADVEGFRVYQPAARGNTADRTPSDLIDTYYAGVELRAPANQMASLVDTTHIEREIGWQPSE